jgi:hypothetical protein
MARSGEKLIEAFIDARRTLHGLEQAEVQEGKTPERTRAIKEAKADILLVQRQMTGGMLGEAQRRERSRRAQDIADNLNQGDEPCTD